MTNRLETRIKRLEGETGDLEETNVIIYDTGIPGDSDDKVRKYHPAHPTKAVILIPDNGRPRSETKPDDNKPS